MVAARCGWCASGIQRDHLVSWPKCLRAFPDRALALAFNLKGTAIIHQKDRLPHNNLELFSNAPVTALEHYEQMGFNATVYAKRLLPNPIVVPTKGEALGARFHARVALTYAIETSMIEDNASPENLKLTFLEKSA